MKQEGNQAVGDRKSKIEKIKTAGPECLASKFPDIDFALISNWREAFNESIL